MDDVSRGENAYLGGDTAFKSRKSWVENCIRFTKYDACFKA